MKFPVKGFTYDTESTPLLQKVREGVKKFFVCPRTKIRFVIFDTTTTQTQRRRRPMNKIDRQTPSQRSGGRAGRARLEAQRIMAAQISSTNHRRAITRKRRDEQEHTKRAMRCLRRGSDEMRHDGRAGYGSTLNWQLLRSRSRQIEHRCAGLLRSICACACACGKIPCSGKSLVLTDKQCIP